MVYVDFEDAAVFELFGFAQDGFDGDCVAVGFGVYDVFDLTFTVEEYVKFAHVGISPFRR